MAHITGGGLLENIPRVLPSDLAVDIDCNAWSLPPVFKWLQQAGNISDIELSRTFNCGIGMVLIVQSCHVERICDLMKQQKEAVFRLGTVVDLCRKEDGADTCQVNMHGQF